MINKIILITVTALAACTPAPPRIIDSSCVSFTPIYPSRGDTHETKRQVLVHNTMWQQICDGALLSKRITEEEQGYPR